MDIGKENIVINSLSRQPVSGSLHDVVTSVHYQMFASGSINETSSLAYVYNSIDLKPPDPDAFLPFDDIKKSVVVKWITSIQGEYQFRESVSRLDQILSSSVNAQYVETLPFSMSLFER